MVLALQAGKHLSRIRQSAWAGSFLASVGSVLSQACLHMPLHPVTTGTPREVRVSREKALSPLHVGQSLAGGVSTGHVCVCLRLHTRCLALGASARQGRGLAAWLCSLGHHHAPAHDVAPATLPRASCSAAVSACSPQVTFHDVAVLTEKLFPIVEAMQKHFSAGSGAYYSDSIFFLSVAMHRIMPEEIHRMIQVDLDLKYKANIRDLFEEFDKFPPGAVIGIAREMQPVYRHTFWQYRRENPQTKVGDPPPDGLPGFNSGVLLLDLEAMRHSPLYNRLLEPAALQELTEKYHFKGHLGDQDFFTLVGMEHPELFHVLDCTWNRQLCTWWKDHGYSDVFHRYYACEGPVKIYHGNCNTPIPDD
ncbi:PREDICTED: xyloside xylosyltransferase 1 [Gavialis gangeticus]|uniref:xyloside xylosyltransferase 1 n=1 Tax=Gavialis gangeticus TaxID=94835 RepID=UPI00092F4C9B|nr:PREDICTED: xyloside xylosyltransferase 1 [Gavialis gangeticus]